MKQKSISYLFVCFLLFLSVQKGYGQSIAAIKKRADAAFQKKEYENAKIDYRQLLAQNQKNSELNFKYATCIYYTEDIKNARKYYDFILAKKDTEFPIETYYYLAKIYQHQYYFETAIEQFNVLKEKDPKLAKAFDVENEISACQSALSGMKQSQTLEVIQKSEPYGNDFYEHYRFADDGYSFYKASEVFTKENAKHQYEPIYAFKRGMKFRVFASYGPESPSLDLYVQRKNEANEWDKPLKIQGIVNTNRDELFPFYDAENGYLYFSSEGHQSMGGFDLFRCIYRLTDNQSLSVENLHFPFSSPNDDYFYVPDLTNGNANFASNRNGKLSAIQTYLVRTAASSKELYFFSGVLSDKIDQSNTTVKVEFVVPETKERFGPFVSRSDGSYLAGLPGPGSYQMEISITGSNQLFKEEIILPVLDEDMELVQEVVYSMVDSKEKVNVVNRVRGKENETIQVMAEKMKLAANLEVNLASFNRKEVLTTAQQFERDWGVVAKDTSTLLAILSDSLLAAEVNLENQVRLNNYLSNELLSLNQMLEGQMKAMDERLEKGMGSLGNTESEEWLLETKQLEDEIVKTEAEIKLLDSWMLANQQKSIPNLDVLKSLEQLNKEMASLQFQQNTSGMLEILQDNRNLIKEQLRVAGEDLSAVIRTHYEEQDKQLLEERKQYQEQGENLLELQKEIAFLKTNLLAAKSKDRPALEAEIESKERLSLKLGKELSDWNEALTQKEKEHQSFAQIEGVVATKIIASEQTPLPTTAINYDPSKAKERQQEISETRLQQKQNLAKQEQQVRSYQSIDPSYSNDVLLLNQESDTVKKAVQLKEREEKHLVALQLAYSKSTELDQPLLAEQIQLTQSRIQQHTETIENDARQGNSNEITLATLNGTSTENNVGSTERTSETATNGATENGTNTENNVSPTERTSETATNGSTENVTSTENNVSSTERTSETATNGSTENVTSTENNVSPTERTSETATNGSTENVTSTENNVSPTERTSETATNGSTENGTSTENNVSPTERTSETATNGSTENGTSTENNVSSTERTSETATNGATENVTSTENNVSSTELTSETATNGSTENGTSTENNVGSTERTSETATNGSTENVTSTENNVSPTERTSETATNGSTENVASTENNVSPTERTSETATNGSTENVTSTENNVSPTERTPETATNGSTENGQNTAVKSVISMSNIESTPQIESMEKQLNELRSGQNPNVTSSEWEQLVQEMESELIVLKRQQAIQESLQEIEAEFPSLTRMNQEAQSINEEAINVRKQSLSNALVTETNPTRKSVMEAELAQLEQIQFSSGGRNENEGNGRELVVPISTEEPTNIDELSEMDAYLTYVKRRVELYEKEQALSEWITKRILMADSIRNLLSNSNEIQIDELRELAAQHEFYVSREKTVKSELENDFSILEQSEHQADFEWMVQHQIVGKTRSNVTSTQPTASPFSVTPTTNLNQVFPAHPVNVPLPDGLIYRIQVGAFRKPVPNQLFREFGPVSGEVLNNGLTCYMAGYFNGAKDALEARNMIRGFGYADAFIVAYCDGKRITYNQGKLMEQNGTCRKKSPEELQLAVNQLMPITVPQVLPNVVNTVVPTTVDPNSTEGNMDLYYTVQVAVYNKAINGDNIKGINELLVTKTEKGQFRYSSGEFLDFDEARKRKNEVVAKGIPDAYVVAYYRGKRISIGEANQLLASGIIPKKRGDQSPNQTINQPSEVVQKIDIPEMKPIVKVDSMVQYELKVDAETYLSQLTRLNRVGTFTYQPEKNRIISAKFKLEDISVHQQLYLSDMKRFSDRKSRIPAMTFEMTNLRSEAYDWLLHQSISYEVKKNQDAYQLVFYPQDQEQAEWISAVSQQFTWTNKSK